MANMAQAVRMALHYAEENLGVTDVFGEDVGPPLGGVFTATQGLKTAWNSPLDERGIIGVAMGAFTLSYDEYARTTLTIGPMNTLPLEIYALISSATSPTLFAIGTVTTAVSFLAIIVSLLVVMRMQSRRTKALAKA
jgi:hypothetical protein